MLNTHKLQRIAITTSALVALCTTQLIAHAETVSITGDIKGSTCSLSLTVGGVETQSFTLGLGNVPLSNATSSPTAGTDFGSPVTLNFRLVAPGGGSACTFSNDTSGWDISIAPAKSGHITTINGSTFLSNMVDVANGGTDAVVRLSGGIGGIAPNPITLTEAGSFVSNPNNPFRAQAASAITLAARFAQPVANQKPNSGIYSSTLTLAVTYR
jgi:hypothetical protein